MSSRCLPKLPAKWGKREIPGEVAKVRKFGRLEKQSQLISWLPSCPAQVKLLPALVALPSPLCGLSLWRVLQMNKRTVCRQSDSATWQQQPACSQLSSLQPPSSLISHPHPPAHSHLPFSCCLPHSSRNSLVCLSCWLCLVNRHAERKAGKNA